MACQPRGRCDLCRLQQYLQLSTLVKGAIPNEGHVLRNRNLFQSAAIFKGTISQYLAGVQRIGSQAFAGCEGLEHVELAEGIRDLNAFTLLSKSIFKRPKALIASSLWAIRSKSSSNIPSSVRHRADIQLLYGKIHQRIWLREIFCAQSGAAFL